MTFNSLITGCILCILITLSSLYSALCMGALPWPTLFAAVFCYAVLSFFKKNSMQNVTLAHTFATSSSMVAGAVAFTLPGLFISGGTVSLARALFAALAGVMPGVFFSAVFYNYFIKERQLSYPIGYACHITLREISNSGTDKKKIFTPFAASGVFAFIRDYLHKIPQMITFVRSSESFTGVSITLSLTALSIGALLSPLLVAVMFSSCVFFNYIAAPFLASSGFSVRNIRETIAFALMLGFGFGSLLKTLCSGKFRHFSMGRRGKRPYVMLSGCLLFFAVAYFFIFRSGFIVSLVLLPAVCISVYLSAEMTGESGINPMEIFAFLAFLLVSLFRSFDSAGAFLIIMSIAVASGLTGDIMNDFKSGSLFAVDHRKQLAVEFAGAVIGVFISVSAIFFMKSKGVIFASARYPSPQASMLSNMITGGKVTPLFVLVLVISAVAAFFGVNTALAGLGIYLPVNMVLTISLGSLIAVLLPRRLEKDIPVIAAGLLTGEGIVAMLIILLTGIA